MSIGVYWSQSILQLQIKSPRKKMKGNRSSSNLNSKQGAASKKSGVTFVYVSAQNFGISIPFNMMTASVKNHIKNQYSAFWNTQFKVWQVSMNHYKTCFKYFQEVSKDEFQGAKINKIPDFVYNATKQMPLQLQTKNSSYNIFKTIKYNELQVNIEPRVLPFYYNLYDFQKQSLDFGIKRHGRLLLADEMGVGKTIQAIALASIYRHQWPFLVICPSSLRLNWQQQITTWLSEYLKKTQIQVYTKGGTPIRQGIKAFIISYDLAWKIVESLDSFKIAIADEAHYLKNTGAKRTDNLIPYLSSRKRVILLTGTPALARPRQIYNLLSIVRPDVFCNFKEFGYRYCDPTMNIWSRKMEYNGCQNGRQLYNIINNHIMIRRLKKDVLSQLPDKQRQQIYVQTDKSIIKEIKQLLTDCGGQGKMENMVMDMLCQFDSKGDEVKDARQTIMQAYVLTGQAKLKAVKEYIIQLLQNGIKILIFAHHMAMLDGIEDALSGKKIKYIRIDGSVNKEKRHQAVMNFQDNPSITAAILSITAAGVGLTMTAASTVVFAELHWTPGMMVQAQDRAHRIGQKSSVNCHYLLGENSLDDILYRNLEKKVHNVSSFVDGRSQKLNIQKVSKGQKGKFTANENQQDKPKFQKPGILFQYERIKPLVDKYCDAESDISSDIDVSIKSKTMNSQKPINQLQKQAALQILEQPHQEGSNVKNNNPYEIGVYEFEKPSYEQDKQQKFEQKKPSEQYDREMVLTESNSSELCKFIIDNANQISEYSQSQSEESTPLVKKKPKVHYDLI